MAVNMIHRVICRSNTEDRTITFFVRKDFGNGFDHRGTRLKPNEERDMAIRVFCDHLRRIINDELPIINETVEVGYDIVYESIDKPISSEDIQRGRWPK